MEGIEYWKPLSDVLLSYIDHKESKLNGDVGVLERKHPNVDGFVYIGKEVGNIDRTGALDKPKYSLYQSEDDLKQKIINMTLEEAMKLRIPRRMFYRLRKSLKGWKDVKVRGKTRRKLNNP